MNRLQHETSPYLLQHAGNPVDWYAWKPEAFEAARAGDKPILVSIGYSTCHWCHVMEHESFEKEAVAEYMNRHFINIKVDREERPDVDQIYMEACQAIHGSGGWPLNCFLTPEGKPFFAGTYYPPQPAHGRPSWLQLLGQMARVYEGQRDKVEAQAEQLTAMIAGSDETFFQNSIDIGEAGESPFGEGAFASILNRMNGQFDKRYGGFGNAPKFPSTMALEFMLKYGYLSEDDEAIEKVHFSLDKIIRGGIYDQLGGGFARYATDRAWLIPHFEKMLYDNALLVKLMASAYQQSGKAIYRDTLGTCIRFVQREMSSPNAGFFSAYDADSEGEEGKFYVWTAGEIQEALGDGAPLFMDYYGVSEAGNWEGKNILWRERSYDEFARERALDPEKLETELADQRRILLQVRSKRTPPGLDDKIILSWNAMMAGAFALAGTALGDQSLIREAEKNLNFLLDNFSAKEGGLWHVYNKGKVQYQAFLDDHALLIEALITVYEQGFELHFLEEADRLCGRVLEQFDDPESPLFYYTPLEQDDLIVRKREVYDSATPSGNSTMASNLLRLGLLLGREDYSVRARDMLARMAPSIEKYPTAFSNWASAALWIEFPPHEIAVVGPEAKAMAGGLNAAYLPNKVIMAAGKPDKKYPLLADKHRSEETLIYVCRDYVCQQPSRDIEDALKLVNE